MIPFLSAKSRRLSLADTDADANEPTSRTRMADTLIPPVAVKFLRMEGSYRYNPENQPESRSSGLARPRSRPIHQGPKAIRLRANLVSGSGQGCGLPVSLPGGFRPEGYLGRNGSGSILNLSSEAPMEPIDPRLDSVDTEAYEAKPLLTWDDFRKMKINVSEAERWASAALGGGLVAYGLRKRRWSGVFFVLAGGALLLRGAL